MSKIQYKRQTKKDYGKVNKGFKPKTKRQIAYNAGRQFSVTPKAELKAFDTNLAVNGTGQLFAAAGNFTVLNAMLQGTDLFNRIGRKIYMKSLRVTGYLVPQDADTHMQQLRFIIVYDSQPNAAAFTLATLLKDSNPTAASNNYSQINLDNRERFTILRDRVIITPDTDAVNSIATNTLSDPCGLKIDEFIPLKGMEVVYNVTDGGTIADITSGALFVATVGASNDWGFGGTFRLRYYD